MVIRLNKKRSIILLLFAIILLQRPLSIYTFSALSTLIRYVDEIISVIAFVILAFYFCKNQVILTKEERNIIVFFCVFVAMGLISNILNPLQNWIINIIDIVTCSRFLIFYLIGRILLKKINTLKLLQEIESLCKFLTLIVSGLAIIQIFIYPLFPRGDYRYFMYSLELFFGHPTYMAIFCMTCISVFIVNIGINEKKCKTNMTYIIILLLLMSFTLRTKAIASAVIVGLLWLTMVKMKITSKVFVIIAGAITAIPIGAKSIIGYYMTNTQEFVRARLFFDSIYLANKHFPLGTGFATFGSAMAAKNYSSIYTMLGYNSLYGGSKKDISFLSDTFWPIVVAQTGWIGFISFILMIFYLIKLSFRLKQNIYFYWAAISIIVYELISSTSETAFFNPQASILFLLFGIIVDIYFSNNSNNKPIKTQH